MGSLLPIIDLGNLEMEGACRAAARALWRGRRRRGLDWSILPGDVRAFSDVRLLSRLSAALLQCE